MPLVRSTEELLGTPPAKQKLPFEDSNAFTGLGTGARFESGSSELSPVALRALRVD